MIILDNSRITEIEVVPRSRFLRFDHCVSVDHDGHERGVMGPGSGTTHGRSRTTIVEEKWGNFEGGVRSETPNPSHFKTIKETSIIRLLFSFYSEGDRIVCPG